MPDSELDKRFPLTDLVLAMYKWRTPKWIRMVAYEDIKRMRQGLPSITK